MFYLLPLLFQITGVVAEDPDYYQSPIESCTRAAGPEASYGQVKDCFNIPLQERGVEDVPDFYPSPIEACMRALGPNATYEQVNECFNHKPSKRQVEVELDISDKADNISFPRREAAELFRRDVVEGLTLTSPNCAGKDVPKNFVTVDIVRALADEACDYLDDQVKAKEWGSFYKLVKGVTKSGPSLHPANLMFNAAWALGAVGLKQIDGQTGPLKDFCHKTLQKLATKNEGCTGELKAEKNGLVNGKTVTGGINGGFNIKAGSLQVGGFSISYLPEDTPINQG